MKEEKKTLRELFRNVPAKKWMILAVLGVVCLLMATYIEEKNFIQGEDESEQITIQTKENSYGEKLEKRLETILSTVEGAGEVDVIITFVDEGEKVVNKDVNEYFSTITEQDSAGGNRISEENKREEDTILSGNEIPYVLQEKTPTVLGVLVVCEGGNSPIIVEKITTAISALFGLPVHKITVLKKESKR